MPAFISWRHLDSDFQPPLSFEQKVGIFYDQALGWQLHIADLLANGGRQFPAVVQGRNVKGSNSMVSPIRHSGFPVLQICLGHFETLGRYLGTRGKDRDAFVAGVHRVFPEWKTTSFADDLYHDARCQLYHNFRRLRVGLALMRTSVRYDRASRRMLLCPERLPRRLKQHLRDYRRDLLANPSSALAKAFATQFDKDAGTRPWLAAS